MMKMMMFDNYYVSRLFIERITTKKYRWLNVLRIRSPKTVVLIILRKKV